MYKLGPWKYLLFIINKIEHFLVFILMLMSLLFSYINKKMFLIIISIYSNVIYDYKIVT